MEIFGEKNEKFEVIFIIKVFMSQTKLAQNSSFPSEIWLVTLDPGIKLSLYETLV